MDTTQPSHVISLLVNNKPGVLIRISLVFARRGYNIDSLVVSPSKDEKFSRMTITASGDAATLDQILKQLNKLVDVIHAIDHTGEVVVERELALIKVVVPPEKRTEIFQIVQHFRGETADLSTNAMTLQITGKSEKIDAMLSLLSGYDIHEMVRTGKIIMARGDLET